MIQPTSWLDVLFYVTFLIPNLLFQLSVKELFLLCGLAIPYGTLHNLFPLSETK